jgi:heat shock protein HtpX
MTESTVFAESTTDWRKQLRKNARRTRNVIAVFIIMYVAIGLLIDVALNAHRFPRADLSIIFTALITLQLTPTATLVMAAIAMLSLFITYSMYDRIMLLGTDYYEITPQTARSLQEQQLYNTIEELKIAAGLRYMPKVYVIEANYMNAFATGYSEKSALVAITRGLLEKLDRGEIQAVMAHELSHIRHGDIKLTLTASVLTNLMLIAVDILFYGAMFSRDERGERRTDPRLVIIVIILRYILPITTILLMLYLSRTREFMADAGCVELMRDNHPLAKALLKIDQDHKQNADAYNIAYSQTAHEDVRRAAYLYDPTQAGIDSLKSIGNLFSTHPNIRDRLAALGFKIKHS